MLCYLARLLAAYRGVLGFEPGHLSLSLYIYIYIYMYVRICMYVQQEDKSLVSWP